MYEASYVIVVVTLRYDEVEGHFANWILGNTFRNTFIFTPGYPENVWCLDTPPISYDI